MKNKTDLLNPTPAQVKHRNRLWVDALLKNKRKARGEMYNHNRGRCCLAVAQDVAYSCGLDIERKSEAKFNCCPLFENVIPLELVVEKTPVLFFVCTHVIA